MPQLGLIGNPLAGFTGGNKMPAPIIAAGITAAGGLLGGLLSGAQKAKERKQSFKDWQKMRQTRISGLEGSPLKPQTPYYGTEQYLPQFDEVMRRAVLGNLQSRLGERAGEWGLDIPGLMESFGQQQQPQLPFSPDPNQFGGLGGQLGKRVEPGEFPGQPGALGFNLPEMPGQIMPGGQPGGMMPGMPQGQPGMPMGAPGMNMPPGMSGQVPGVPGQVPGMPQQALGGVDELMRKWGVQRPQTPMF